MLSGLGMTGLLADLLVRVDAEHWFSGVDPREASSISILRRLRDRPDSVSD